MNIASMGLLDCIERMLYNMQIKGCLDIRRCILLLTLDSVSGSCILYQDLVLFLLRAIGNAYQSDKKKT